MPDKFKLEFCDYQKRLAKKLEDDTIEPFQIIDVPHMFPVLANETKIEISGRNYTIKESKVEIYLFYDTRVFCIKYFVTKEKEL